MRVVLRRAETISSALKNLDICGFEKYRAAFDFTKVLQLGMIRNR